MDSENYITDITECLEDKEFGSFIKELFTKCPKLIQIRWNQKLQTKGKRVLGFAVSQCGFSFSDGDGARNDEGKPVGSQISRLKNSENQILARYLEGWIKTQKHILDVFGPDFRSFEVEKIADMNKIIDTNIILNILERRKQGTSYQNLGKEFSLARGTIRRICRENGK